MHGDKATLGANAGRLDTSGFDINFGSEVNSPLSKKMQMNATGTAPHETALIKLKAGHFSMHQTSDEEGDLHHNLLYTTMSDADQTKHGKGRDQKRRAIENYHNRHLNDNTKNDERRMDSEHEEELHDDLG